MKIKKYRGLFAGLLAGVILTGVAQAAIPDNGGVIHGCRKLNNPNRGQVLVIDTEAGQTCPSGYEALSWEAGPRPGTPYGLHRVNTRFSVPDNGEMQTFYVTCPSGESAMHEQAWFGEGNGGLLSDIHPEAVASNVVPDDSPTPSQMVFYVRGGSPGTGSDTLQTYVTCGKYS